MNARKLTHTGAMFDLLNPSPEDVRLDDIAHALARLARFTGHGDEIYTVAQHCVVTAELARLAGASRAVQAWALLHDAEEAYTGDCNAPMKWAMADVTGQVMGPAAVSAFAMISYGISQAIALRFGVASCDVYAYDHDAALLEVECNGPHSCAAHTWPEYRGPRPTALPGGVWRTELAEFMWRQRAAELGLR